jgi:hypothetical protein
MGTEMNEDLSRLSSAAKKLTDEELIARLKQCVTRGRQCEARTLVHMSEVDARKLYRDQGYSSMFDYVMRALHMSEAEAGLRITAARFGRQYPQAFEMLARGEVHISALCVLASVLTRETIGLLEHARFKSKKEVEELRATHFPKRDVATQFHRLSPRKGAPNVPSPETARASRTVVEHGHAPVLVPLAAQDAAGVTPCVSSAHDAAAAAPNVPSAQDTAGVTPCVSSAEAIAPSTPATEVQSFRLEPPVTTFSLVPLGEGRTAVRFTASQRWGDKLRQAQHLMRHRVPGGDPIAILECALDMLIADRKKKLFGRTAKPRRTSPKSASSGKPSRYIPRAVRREVADRDGEQCAFVAPDGQRCAERGRIELDHHPIPAARGGRSTPDNLRLLCAAHNALEAERAYGPAFIRQRIAAAREASRSSRASRSRNEPRGSTRQRVEATPDCVSQGSSGDATALVPVTGRPNHPLAVVREPAARNAEHPPSRAAASGSAPTLGAIVDSMSATHRPDGAIAPSGSAPTG